MLGKLIKYDLKWHNRVFIPLYIISLGFAVLTRILMEIGENSGLIHIISLVFSGITYSLLANILINTITRVISKFVVSLYKDESYLTHTLPVSRKTLFLSKILVSMTYMAVSIVIILLSLAIILYTPDNFEMLKSALELTAGMYDSSVVILLLTFALTIIIEFILFEMIGYLGIVLGYKSNDRRAIKSVVYSLLIYFGIQTITVLIVLCFGLFNEELMTAISTNKISLEAVKFLLWSCNIIYAAYSIILYYIARNQLNKGVNVD